MSKFIALFTNGFILLIFFSSIASCSGSGGGGGDSPPASLQYIGNTDQAVVTSESAPGIIQAAYRGSSAGQKAVVGGGRIQVESGTVASAVEIKPQHYNVLLAIFQPIVEKKYYVSNQIVLGAEYENSQFVAGPDGGNAEIKLNSNDGYHWYGSVAYNNFMDGNIQINGNADITSYLNSWGTINNISISTNRINVLYGSEQVDFSGSMFLEYFDEKLTVNMVTYSNNTGVYTKLENFIIVGEGYEMQGRFYHAWYGYVDVSTTDPFLYNSGDDYPHSGEAVVVGASNSSAKMVVKSASGYDVECDEDGDGAFELFVGTYTW